MPGESCATCPTLRAEVRRLARDNERLYIILSELRATVSGQVRFIAAETEPGEATMPRDRALRRVHDRLTAALVDAGGQ